MSNQNSSDRKVFMASYPREWFMDSGARSRAMSTGLMDVENENLTVVGLIAKLREWQEEEGGVDAYVYDDAVRRLRSFGKSVPSGIRRLASREARIASRISSVVDDIWAPTRDGWSTFLSDLEANNVFVTPEGYPVHVRTFQVEKDRDNDIVSWKKRMPNGKMVVVFND